MIYEIYCDGAVNRNPGGTASYGFVLYGDHKELSWGSGIIGSGARMNNVLAEYYAISQALSNFIRIWKEPESSLIIYNDSKYVVAEIMKDRILGPQLRELKRHLDVKIVWIPRDKNLADHLAHRHDSLRLPSIPKTKG